jgi:hypothetical protein
MAYTFNGSTQYLSTASAPASGLPMTIAAWLRPTTLAGMRAVTVGVNGGTHRNQLGVYTTANLLGIQAVSVGTNGGFVSQTDVIASSGTLFHGCAVLTSSTSRTAYLNGTAAVTNTTNVGTQDTANAVSIGSGWATTLGAYYTGDIAEVGVWDVALTAAEVASLAKGFTCDRVRLDNLVFYAPLIRDLIDKVGGRTITNNNTATVANHPRVYA